MAKGNILYTVKAGSRSDGYYTVYETTKRSKADEFVHTLMRQVSDYDKIWIESQPVTKLNKRDLDWED